MAKQKHISQTPATQLLTKQGIAYETATYDYEEHGGALHAAKELGADEYQVVKTLIMQDEHEQPLVVLMHGNKQVSTKNLARQINAKHVQPCKPEVAQRHSGYMVGGTSPFSTRKAMPVYAEKTILDLPEIYINGGKRGFLLRITPDVLVTLLNAVPVDCAID